MTDNGSRFLLIGVQKIFDIVLILLSFGLAAVVIVRTQHTISLGQLLSTTTRISTVATLGVALLVCHIALCMCGTYKSRRLSNIRAESWDLCKATTLSMVCFVFIGSVGSIRMITLPFLVLFWIVSTAMLCVSHLFLRAFLARIRARGRNMRNMLILGTNRRAIEFARKLDLNPGRGYRLLGFVDDDWPGLGAFHTSGHPLVSNYAGLAAFLRRNVVDEIAIYLPLGSFYRHSAEVAGLCEQHGVIMRYSSEIFDRNMSRRYAEEFDGEYFIASYPGAADSWQLIVKRTLDIVGSVSLIVLSSPLLVAISVALKLRSPGPVLFLQERIGLNKRRFLIYKFRTMVPDAERMMSILEPLNEISGPVFKIRNDPRVTPLGRFLRRSSMDELPQLFNVLKGEMSLVGPRPTSVRDFEGFREDWQRRRFSMKPGITCLWQVSGRNHIPFEQWMRLDLQYMDEWTLWLDLKILAKTVPAVLKGSGAA